MRPWELLLISGFVGILAAALSAFALANKVTLVFVISAAVGFFAVCGIFVGLVALGVKMGNEAS